MSIGKLPAGGQEIFIDLFRVNFRRQSWRLYDGACTLLFTFPCVRREWAGRERPQGIEHATVAECYWVSRQKQESVTGSLVVGQRDMCLVSGPDSRFIIIPPYLVNTNGWRQRRQPSQNATACCFQPSRPQTTSISREVPVSATHRDVCSTYKHVYYNYILYNI